MWREIQPNITNLFDDRPLVYETNSFMKIWSSCAYSRQSKFIDRMTSISHNELERIFEACLVQGVAFTT